MTAPPPMAVCLREWETLRPETCPTLRNRFLAADDSAAAVVRELAARQMLRLTELRTGLQIEATSFVGRVRLGDLTITVQPKVAPAPLLGLLRYAYGLGDLNLIGENAAYGNAQGPDIFHDLLLHQLHAEIDALIAHGLYRAYVGKREALANPRGRIDINRLARSAASGRTRQSATLPCTYYEQNSDTALHRVLIAGLCFAEEVGEDAALQASLRRLRYRLEAQVGATTAIDCADLPTAVETAQRGLSRLTAAYRPALTLIGLLLSAESGPSLIAETDSFSAVRLPGFLFDMNRFFQRLIERFLTDYLPAECQVQSERGLRRLFAYHPEHNPHRRRPPDPAPRLHDFSGRANRRSARRQVSRSVGQSAAARNALPARCLRGVRA